MPPRKKQKASSPVATKFSVQKVSKLPKRSSNALQGILALPTEIILEILACCDFPLVDEHTRIIGVHQEHVPRVLSRGYLERDQVLRSLSQTCFKARAQYLPLLWESLNVYVGPAEPTKAWYKYLADALERKSVGLRENPSLASHVGIVNVVLTRWQMAKVIPQLKRCLEALLNVHTIHILHAHMQMTTALKIGFEGLQLPSIRTLIIPSQAHELLRCCPKVRAVICNDGDGGRLVTQIQRGCKNVERIGGFRPDEKLMKRIIKAMPNLRSIELDHLVKVSVPSLLNLLRSDEVDGKESVAMLSALKHLRCIQLDTNSFENQAPRPATLECIAAAKKVLHEQGHSDTERRHLRAIYKGVAYWGEDWQEIFYRKVRDVDLSSDTRL